MTSLDAIILLLLGAGALLGFMRGFVQEVLSLSAWVIAALAVRVFLAPASDLMGAALGGMGGAAILAFLLLFFGTFYLGRLLARRIGQHSRTSILGPIDRVLGAGFGIIKALIGATLVFLGFTLCYNMVYGVRADRPDWIAKARSYSLLDASGEAISRFARHQAGARNPSLEKDAVAANASRAVLIDAD